MKFKRVLIAEDMDDISKGLVQAMHESGISELQHVQYCDDALLKIKKGLLDNQPFDLLISDLSFEQDYRQQKLDSGAALAEAAKKIDPDLKIIIYSIEDRLQMVRKLMQSIGVEAYVCKGRHGLRDLGKAMEEVYLGNSFTSGNVRGALRDHHEMEIDDFDILLISKLAEGYSQDEISSQLKQQGIKPSSLSSIEKRLNRLKVQLQANNAIHLVSMAKDLGLV